MKESRYVAYVATYTHGSNAGLRIYDADIGTGRFKEREAVTITNPSYFTLTHNKKYLYSITDAGVEAFAVKADGGLLEINKAPVNGMRGCHISTDYEDKYLFVAGYHDGKVTVLRLNEDGSAGEITDEVFHRGLGSIAERNFRPHVSCVKMTRDNKYLCAADLGLDHTKVYRLDHATGKLKLADLVRSEVESAPKFIKFSLDGRYAYINHELKNIIDVYEYKDEDDNPSFTKIQTVSTLNNYHATDSASCALKFSWDGRYIFCSNAGDNSVGAFCADSQTGLLTKEFVLPVSGDYPKDIAIFPDAKHLVSLNHESGTLTFFNMDLEKKLIVMNGKEMKVAEGNCISILRLDREEA